MLGLDHARFSSHRVGSAARFRLSRLAVLALSALVTNAGCSSTSNGDPQPGSMPKSDSMPKGNASTAESSAEITSALDWLVRHQGPDGQWSSNSTYTGRCQDPNAYANDIVGADGFDVGVTSLSMLALARAGHTHRSTGNYGTAQRKALDWVLGQQIETGDPRTDGTFGLVGASQQVEEGRIYNHAISTLVLAELLVRTGDEGKLRKPLERAAQFCIDARTPGLGWRYEYQSPKCDSSVTGWMTLALLRTKDCAEKGLCGVSVAEIDEAVDGGLEWFNLVTSRRDFRTGYTAPGDPGAEWMAYGKPYPYSKELSSMTAVSVSCQLEADAPKENELVRGGVDLLKRNPPSWRPTSAARRSTINHFYWYYGSYAISQFGGPDWKAWRDALADALIPHQIRTSDKDGSWDPIGEWGAAGGRTYATAISALALELHDEAP